MMPSFNIAAFLGETFFESGGKFWSRTANLEFLNAIPGAESLSIISPTNPKVKLETGLISAIDVDHFTATPPYVSTHDFLTRSIISRKYLVRYRAIIDNFIDSNRGSVFWARTPSVGSLLFARCVLRKGEILVNHVCADATETWREDRYSGVKRAPAFLASRYIQSQLAHIASNPKTLNFTTGAKLEEMVRVYAPLRTTQFVDMVSSGSLPRSRVKKPNELRAVFIGRLVADKGIFDIVQAISKLDGGVSLAIVGSGPDEERLREFVNTASLGDRVQFIGQVPNSQVRDHIVNSDVLVVPSRNRYEGFPRVIMEGWEQGVPVIVSRVGGVEAFVRDRENGLLVNPGSVDDLVAALLSLRSDHSLCARLIDGIEQMRETASMQHWAQVAHDAIVDHLNNTVSD